MLMRLQQFQCFISPCATGFTVSLPTSRLHRIWDSGGWQNVVCLNDIIVGHHSDYDTESTGISSNQQVLLLSMAFKSCSFAFAALRRPINCCNITNIFLKIIIILCSPGPATLPLDPVGDHIRIQTPLVVSPASNFKKHLPLKGLKYSRIYYVLLFDMSHYQQSAHIMYKRYDTVCTSAN